jgi:hypothetical protein
LNTTGDQFASPSGSLRGSRITLVVPPPYLDFNGEDIVAYVRVCSLILDATGLERYAEPNSHEGFLGRDQDGRFCYAIAMVLERDDGAFPKFTFFYEVRFAMGKDDCEMTIGCEGMQTTFRVPTDSADARNRVDDHMVGIMKGILSYKPWDTPEKVSMGFAGPPRPLRAPE